jgi:hypothetical protein
VKGPDGRISFKCDPFHNVREPECLAKWQLLRTSEVALKMDRMISAYEATLAIYRRLQPLQEKMFRHMEQEMEELEEGDTWKRGEAEDDESEEE